MSRKIKNLIYRNNSKQLLNIYSLAAVNMKIQALKKIRSAHYRRDARPAPLLLTTLNYNAILL